MPFLPRSFSFLCLAAALAVSASAQTLLHHWRFGENDSDDKGYTWAGNLANQDYGLRVYTDDPEAAVVKSSLTPGPASTVSAAFTASSYFRTDADVSLAQGSRFIVEGWFYFDGTPPATTNLLFYNGNPSTTGIGFYVNGTTLHVLEGGVDDHAVGAVQADQWNYVALVYEAGNFRTYINSDSSHSYAYGQVFADYGSDPGYLYVGGGFDGLVDDLRISRFTGAFAPSMLNYAAMNAVPEPATCAGIAGLAGLALALHRRRKLRIRSSVVR